MAIKSKKKNWLFHKHFNRYATHITISIMLLAVSGAAYFVFKEGPDKNVAGKAYMAADTSSDEVFVQRLYDTILGRQPDCPGFTGAVKALKSGTTRQQLFEKFTASHEYRSSCWLRDKMVKRLYNHVLGRDATEPEIAKWLSSYASKSRWELFRDFLSENKGIQTEIGCGSPASAEQDSDAGINELALLPEEPLLTQCINIPSVKTSSGQEGYKYDNYGADGTQDENHEETDDDKGDIVYDGQQAYDKDILAQDAQGPGNREPQLGEKPSKKILEENENGGGDRVPQLCTLAASSASHLKLIQNGFAARLPDGGNNRDIEKGAYNKIKEKQKSAMKEIRNKKKNDNLPALDYDDKMPHKDGVGMDEQAKALADLYHEEGVLSPGKTAGINMWLSTPTATRQYIFEMRKIVSKGSPQEQAELFKKLLNDVDGNDKDAKEKAMASIKEAAIRMYSYANPDLMRGKLGVNSPGFYERGLCDKLKGAADKNTDIMLTLICKKDGKVSGHVIETISFKQTGSDCEIIADDSNFLERKKIRITKEDQADFVPPEPRYGVCEVKGLTTVIVT